MTEQNKIEENYFYINKKIIVVTSCNSEATNRKATELGANYYMLKPVSEDKLIEKVKELTTANDKINVGYNIDDNNQSDYVEQIDKMFNNVDRGFLYTETVYKVKCNE